MKCLKGVALILVLIMFGYNVKIILDALVFVPNPHIEELLFLSVGGVLIASAIGCPRPNTLNLNMPTRFGPMSAPAPTRTAIKLPSSPTRRVTRRRSIGRAQQRCRSTFRSPSFMTPRCGRRPRWCSRPHSPRC